MKIRALTLKYKLTPAMTKRARRVPNHPKHKFVISVYVHYYYGNIGTYKCCFTGDLRIVDANEMVNRSNLHTYDQARIA
ncbi:hypothetical protein GJ496_005017 [Pomphorhynchus laevis]|nr:hypothetical protein GJ496_005017 [Pomphorhynchus laevis]